MRARLTALGMLGAVALAACGGAGGSVPVTSSLPANRAAMQPHITRNSWSAKSPMPVAEFGPGTVTTGDTLYVMGGTSNPCCAEQAALQAYDASADAWTAKTPMPTPRNFLAAGTVNGILYAIGGFGQAGVLNTVEAYNPHTGTWTTKAPMPTAREELTVRSVGGILYAMGGYAVLGRKGANETLVPVNVVEAYDPSTNTWSTKAPMLGAYAAAAAVVFKNTIYVMGGLDARNAYSSAVEVYDPVTNAWTAKAAMPTARYGLAAANVDGTLYAVGGWSSAGVTGALEAYNPVTNSWTAKTPMPTARYGLAVRGIHRVLYAAGGRDGSQTALDTLEAYTP